MTRNDETPPDRLLTVDAAADRAEHFLAFHPPTYRGTANRVR